MDPTPDQVRALLDKMTTPDATDRLVEARGQEYGESWRLTDEFIREHSGEILNSPSPFSLILIHNKLMRALTSPMKRDHFDDIMGYCKLMLTAIESDETTINTRTGGPSIAQRERDRERMRMRGFEG